VSHRRQDSEGHVVPHGSRLTPERLTATGNRQLTIGITKSDYSQHLARFSLLPRVSLYLARKTPRYHDGASRHVALHVVLKKDWMKECEMQ